MPRTKAALLDWKKHLEYARKRRRIIKVKSDRVFCRLDGTPIKRFDTVWRRIRNKANISNFHFHDLRHTFCSSLILSGASLKDVKEMIGHSDITMTDRYSHLSEYHKHMKQKRLAEYYQNGYAT